MKGPLNSVSMIFPFFLAASMLMVSTTGGGMDMEQGGWPKPIVDSVEISLRNTTGFFTFAFTAHGSAPEGTQTMNVTFGTLNGTEVQLVEGLWFEEGGFIFLGNGISLQADGNETYPWSTWTFKIRLALPYGGDPESLIGTIGGMIPFEIDNSSLEDLDLGPENLTRALASMQFFFVGRAYNETGAWGQEAYNITAHVQTAVLQFMIDEGLLEDPSTDDDDTGPVGDDDDNGGGEVSTELLVGMAVFGVILLFAAVIIAVFLIISRSRKR